MCHSSVILALTSLIFPDVVIVDRPSVEFILSRTSEESSNVVFMIATL